MRGCQLLPGRFMRTVSRNASTTPPRAGKQMLSHEPVEGPRRRRKVVVVGGGPAGLEAARVLGEHGHEVVVFEAAPRGWTGLAR